MEITSIARWTVTSKQVNFTPTLRSPPAQGCVFGRVSRVPRGDRHRQSRERRGRYYGNGDTERERRLKAVKVGCDVREQLAGVHRLTAPTVPSPSLLTRWRSPPSRPLRPGRRPLRSGPTALSAHGAAASGSLRGLEGGGEPALSRRPPLEPGQASGVPVACSRTGGLLKTGRATPPPHSPSAIPPAALTRTTRPPPFSSRARRRPGRRRRLPLFRDLLRRRCDPVPFLLPSRCFSGCLPHSPRGGVRGISPPRASAEPSRHFLLATAPERWAGTLLPRYHRDRAGDQRLPRAPAPRFCARHLGWRWLRLRGACPLAAGRWAGKGRPGPPCPVTPIRSPLARPSPPPSSSRGGWALPHTAVEARLPAESSSRRL